MSARDSAPLFTGRNIGNSLISLVSFKTAEVVATMAALRVALVATSRFKARERCGEFAPTEMPITRHAKATIANRNWRIRFDIVGLSLL